MITVKSDKTTHRIGFQHSFGKNGGFEKETVFSQGDPVTPSSTFRRGSIDSSLIWRKEATSVLGVATSSGMHLGDQYERSNMLHIADAHEK
jgi:hypothetical protein